MIKRIATDEIISSFSTSQEEVKGQAVLISSKQCLMMTVGYNHLFKGPTVLVFFIERPRSLVLFMWASHYTQRKKPAARPWLSFFKKKKFGASKSVRLFVSNDFSKKVQQMRREKIPELGRLKEQGHQAFLVYPATIKIRDPAGRIRDP